jgi:hypothetical protein
MSDLSNQKTTSQDRKETAHKANAVSSRVWLDDQCGHSCLEEVLDRHGNSSSEFRHRTGNDRPIAARRFLVQLTHIPRSELRDAGRHQEFSKLAFFDQRIRPTLAENKPAFRTCRASPEGTG